MPRSSRSARVAGLGADDLVIISPNDPDAMVQYAQECSTLGIPYIWDPGQQCARMEGVQLAEGVRGAFVVIANDYEFELLRQKTGMGEDAIVRQAEVLVITKGEAGCSVLTKEGRTDVPAVPPVRIEDPTGVGDAFRGGLMKGLAAEAPYEVCARLGSVAATYALGASWRHQPRLHATPIRGAVRGALRPAAAAVGAPRRSTSLERRGCRFAREHMSRAMQPALRTSRARSTPRQPQPSRGRRRRCGCTSPASKTTRSATAGPACHSTPPT